MTRGIVFDIKRYAIHDGPGIRTTVFFKGCGLRCQWCQNPEGQDMHPELMIREKRCAARCHACVEACPRNAISKNGSSLRLDREACDLCGKCAEACVYEAVEVVGREMTVKEVADIIERDRIFFEESGGGVTFSGGEPLVQIDFLDDLLDEVKKQNIHVALDTCGCVPFRSLERISDRVDLFLYDVKMMDEKKHRRYTGTSNDLALDNLRRLSESGKAVIIRVPLLSGINDDEQGVQMLADFLRLLPGVREISLLPYHRGGREKFRRLRKGKSQKSFQAPSEEKMQTLKKILRDAGFRVKRGG